METKITTLNIYSEKVEKMLSTLRVDLLEIANRDGKYVGLKDRLALDAPTLVPYYANIKSRAEHGRSDLLSITQPDMHVSAIQSIDANTKAKVDELTKDIDRLEHENDVAQLELQGKTPPEKRPSNVLPLLLSIAVNLADFIFIVMSFEFLGDGLGFAIFIGLGVAAAIFALSKAITYFMRRAAAEGRKYYFAAAGCFVAALGAFWVLSYFRTQMMAESNVSISAPMFFLFNILFFVAAIVIPIIFAPSQKQAEAEKETARKFAAVDARTELIKRKKAEREAILNAAKKEREEHVAILSYVAHSMNRINTMYFEAVAQFKSQVLLTRQDRSVPTCFTEPIAELSGIDFKLPPTLTLPVA